MSNLDALIYGHAYVSEHSYSYSEFAWTFVGTNVAQVGTWIGSDKLWAVMQFKVNERGALLFNISFDHLNFVTGLKCLLEDFACGLNFNLNVPFFLDMDEMYELSIKTQGAETIGSI